METNEGINECHYKDGGVRTSRVIRILKNADESSLTKNIIDVINRFPDSKVKTSNVANFKIVDSKLYTLNDDDLNISDVQNGMYELK